MEVGRRVGNTAFTVQLYESRMKAMEAVIVATQHRRDASSRNYLFSNSSYTSENSKADVALSAVYWRKDSQASRSEVSCGLFVFAHRLPRG